MKAWICSYYSEGGTILVHAETRGKARKRFHNLAYSFSCDFLDVRAIRFPELDDKPFTYENCSAAGFRYYGDGYNDDGDHIYITDDSLYLECACELCRSAR
jgi:hypothetical protein